MTLRRVCFASWSTAATRGFTAWRIPLQQFSSVNVGQPSFETHPHLMQQGELTPGFSAAEYAHRRARLVDTLPPNSVALFAAAAPVHLPNTIIPYPAYRQDADFAYLTGVTQPGVVGMVQVGETRGESKYTLFVPPKSKHSDVWNGPRISVEAAVGHFASDEAHEIVGDNMANVITSAVASARGGVFLDEGVLRFDDSIRATLGTAAKRPPQALRPVVHQLRWVKSSAELLAIRKSVNADIEGFKEAMRWSIDGTDEHEVGARHEFVTKRNGAQRLAYPSVVASGPGALVVHYAAMDKLMRDGELLLMDAGCERNGYVSDITRTWPVSGAFTTAQADVYEAVLDAHAACVAAARVGVSLHELHQISVSVLQDGLRNLGVGSPLSKGGNGVTQNIQKFYPHSVGHWLGMDTHDTPTVSTQTPLTAGNAFTIEPGLYFPLDAADVPHSLRGIGVRIEDNLAVNHRGAVEVLSEALPVHRREVEQFLRELRS